MYHDQGSLEINDSGKTKDVCFVGRKLFLGFVYNTIIKVF